MYGISSSPTGLHCSSCFNRSSKSEKQLPMPNQQMCLASYKISILWIYTISCPRKALNHCLLCCLPTQVIMQESSHYVISLAFPSDQLGSYKWFNHWPGPLICKKVQSSLLQLQKCFLLSIQLIRVYSASQGSSLCSTQGYCWLFWWSIGVLSAPARSRDTLGTDIVEIVRIHVFSPFEMGFNMIFGFEGQRIQANIDTTPIVQRLEQYYWQLL